jgi:hypothetical protein
MCEETEAKKAQKGRSVGRGQSNAAPDHEKSSGDQDLPKFSQVGEPKSTERGTPCGVGSAQGDPFLLLLSLCLETSLIPTDYSEWISQKTSEVGLPNPEEAS